MAMWYHAMPEVSEEQLGRWQVLLESQTGINLQQHEHILRKGLNPWLDGMSEDEAELTLVRSETRPWPGMGAWLVDHLEVKETSFYRTPAAYRHLSRYLQERLVQSKGQALSLDLWSAGCSTGEEAYSMAMVASEMIQLCRNEAFFGVIGSDISSAAVKVARQARYHARRLKTLPEGLRSRHMFSEDSTYYHVKPELASRVCFVQSNLLDPQATPVSKMDVIFCTNVLVYFRSWRRRQVLDNLVQRLKPGGLMVIGASEGQGWSHPGLQKIEDNIVLVFKRVEEAAVA